MKILSKNRKPEHLIKLFNPNELSNILFKDGYDFIRRRFYEEWGVVRTDVGYQRIYQRSNVVLFKEDRVIGWLGIEDNNEFTTACIEKGENGVVLLRDMIDLYIQRKPDINYFAYVPIEKTGSVRAFLMAGWKIKKPDILCNKKYLDKTITLIKVIFNKNWEEELYEVAVEEEINYIRRINNECNS